MKKLLLILMLLITPTFSLASDYVGTIETFVCHTIYPSCQIRVSGAVTGATCATGAYWQYAFDATTAEGKNILSMLMTAQATQKSVTMGGLNTCNITGGESEDLRHIYINN